MAFRLGINTGFAVNRYSEPEEWTRVINQAGCHYAQFTADLLNVSLPDTIVQEQSARIKDACQKYEIDVTSTFTGAFTRVNHLAHPDAAVRDYWVDWFKRFVDLSLDLGSKQIGSHFGIFTMKDDRDPSRREERLAQNIDGWHKIGEYAAQKGAECILWEPMSISREQGETIEKCAILQEQVNTNAPIPFKMCLDVDHGDVTSLNPDDTNPYKWLDAFALDSPVIHLKQSLKSKGGHYPFTEEFNKQGNIVPEKVMDVIKSKGIKDADMVLELSFREREPADSSAEAVLKESAEYWKPVIG
jgi:sugar phosphate isomerase/epimerase